MQASFAALTNLVINVQCRVSGTDKVPFVSICEIYFVRQVDLSSFNTSSGYIHYPRFGGSLHTVLNLGSKTLLQTVFPSKIPLYLLISFSSCSTGTQICKINPQPYHETQSSFQARAVFRKQQR